MIDTSPVESVLGVPITLRETFLYYDGPRVFSATDKNGKLYLIDCVDEDFMGDTKLEVYLAAEIAPDCESFVPNHIYSQSGVIKIDITYDGFTGLFIQQDTICESVPKEFVPISQEKFSIKRS